MDGSATYDQYYNNPASPLNNSVRQPGLNFEQNYQIQNSYVDNAGVISTTNFTQKNISNLAFTIATTSAGTDVPNTFGTFVLRRKTNVVFLFSGSFDNNSTSGNAFLDLYVDGTSTYGAPVQIENKSGAALTLSNFYQTNLGVGTHTTHLHLSTDGVGTAVMIGAQVSWLLLGN